MSFFGCRAPRGARGLKYVQSVTCYRCTTRRAPRGARGLKYSNRDFKSMPRESRPSRGAWIEINSPTSDHGEVECRAPRGARGLKSFCCVTSTAHSGRAPRGARGLKWLISTVCSRFLRRAPRGARGLKSADVKVGDWISSRAPRGARGLKSYCGNHHSLAVGVAPRMGRVD